MDPHDTTRPTRPDVPRATAPPTRTFGPQGPTLGDLIDAYLQDYQVRQFRSVSTARGRTAHLAAFFGRAARAAGPHHATRSASTNSPGAPPGRPPVARRAAGAATGTINRETSALHRMGTLAVHWGWLDTVPGFPDRLRENPPRQGFFEHPEYLAVRVHLPAPWQDILDLAYYSGWRKNEILGLTWDEIDRAGGVIRLSPARSKTLVGRILPISPPIAEALARRRARRDPDSPLVFHRDGIPIRRWGGLDGEIRVAPLPTPPAAPAGRPGSDRLRGQPHRHIAASNEGLVIGRPVRHAVLRLVRGMDLRLHPCSVAPAEGHEKCAPPHRVFMQQRPDGQPWSTTSSLRTRVTRRLGSDTPMAISKPSRLPSSMTVSSRIRRRS